MLTDASVSSELNVPSSDRGAGFPGGGPELTAYCLIRESYPTPFVASLRILTEPTSTAPKVPLRAVG